MKKTADAETLRALVAEMRRLGVTEYEGVKLGPEPQEPPEKPTAQELIARQEERDARVRDIQFAACRVRPLIRAVKK